MNNMRRNQGKILTFISVFILGVIVLFIVLSVLYVYVGDFLKDHKEYPMKTIDEMSSNYFEIQKVSQNNRDISKNYYYVQLDEYGKKIYKKMYENKENLKTGRYIINFDTEFNTILNTDNGQEILKKSYYSALSAFFKDNVDVFYIDQSKMVLLISYYTLENVKTCYASIKPKDTSYLVDEFDNNEKIEEAEKYLENIKSKIANELKDYSDYEKIKYVHDWLVDNVEYDKTISEKNIFDIYGALKNKKVVCKGYAKTFKYIIDDLNIPCVLVNGRGIKEEESSELHAWNYVMLEGKWYAIDATWNDPSNEEDGIIIYMYKRREFLKGSEDFFETHKEEDIDKEDGIEFRLPSLSEKNHKYYFNF